LSKLCDARGVELIDTEQRARRLARAVATDIVLYNEKQLSAGADLSREIAEGRSHFCARVTPDLHWIFDEVLAGTALGKKAVSPSALQAGAARAEAAPARVAPSPALREPPSAVPKVQPPRPASSAPPAPVTTSRAKLEPSRPDPPPPVIASSVEPEPSRPVPPVQPLQVEPSDRLPPAAQTRSIKGLAVVLVLCLLGLAAGVGWLVRH
jgi:hypothetical protein